MYLMPRQLIDLLFFSIGSIVHCKGCLETGDLAKIVIQGMVKSLKEKVCCVVNGISTQI